MFTGIVEGMGRLVRLSSGPLGARLELDLGPVAEGVKLGDSISVEGCCLTVAAFAGSTCSFDAVPETVSRTTLGEKRHGDLLNLERSVALGGRLGGHLVTGHIDGRGTVASVERKGSEWDFTVEVPPALRRFFIEKGSVALNGISLTVAALTDTGFRVAVIPHTMRVTSMGRLKQGDSVNVELDVLGKWVARLLEKGRIEGGVSLETLAREGFAAPGS